MVTKVDYDKFRNEALDYLGGVCVKCGTTEQLEFDHINPSTKTYNISKKWSLPTSKHYAELDKCQLLCYTHHKEKHIGGHGSHAEYKRGCRCVLCKGVHDMYQRQYRAKQKLAREELMVDSRDCES